MKSDIYTIESYNKDMGWYKISKTVSLKDHERDWEIYSCFVCIEPKRRFINSELINE